MATLKISDLSVGDWVKCDSKIYQLTSISNDGEVELEFDDEYNYRCRGASVDDLKPIPITAEILEKNGWWVGRMHATLRVDEHIDLEYYFHEHQLRKWYCGKDERENHQVISEITMRCQCRYIHQLQYALRLAGVDKEINL